MPPKKAATTAVTTAAEFDVAGWLEELQQQGYKPRNVEVKMHIRGDLVPRLRDLIDEIQRLQDAPPTTESSIDEADPLDEAVAEYEQLQTEFTAGGSLTFAFRPMTKRIQNETFKQWSEAWDEKTDPQKDQLVLMRMAATCVEFPGKDRFPDGRLTPEALDAFEETFGMPAFQTLVSGFIDAYSAGGEPQAPFSLKRSRTRDTEE